MRLKQACDRCHNLKESWNSSKQAGSNCMKCRNKGYVIYVGCDKCRGNGDIGRPDTGISMFSTCVRCNGTGFCMAYE